MGKRPFVIDCDTGTDDAIAIIAALCCDEIEVKAVTSVNGNVAHKYTSVNNLNLLEYLGKDEIPVAKGADKPLSGVTFKASNTHGNTGMGDVQLPAAKYKTFDERVASELIYQLAKEEGGELELLVIGPMTNIAICCLEHEDLPKLIKHIWFMGGAVEGGNVTQTAEFNIWVDPLAAHIVCMSGIPLTMVGLDVTTKAAMTEKEAKELDECGSKESKLTAELLDFMFRRRDRGGEDALMHDAMALAAAVIPECFTLKDYFVDVEYEGRYTGGHTMVDMRGRYGKAPNCSVALRLDSERFIRWLTDTIKKSADR